MNSYMDERIREIERLVGGANALTASQKLAFIDGFDLGSDFQRRWLEDWIGTYLGGERSAHFRAKQAQELLDAAKRFPE